MKLINLLGKENLEWIPQKRIVEDDNKFKDCPYCKGEIVQKYYGGWTLPIPSDPECKSCERRFHPQKKWYILKGFSIEEKI